MLYILQSSFIMIEDKFINYENCILLLLQLAIKSLFYGKTYVHKIIFKPITKLRFSIYKQASTVVNPF